MKTPVILIVEDDPIIGERLQMTLEKWGYDTLTADWGETAVQLALDQNPSMILMDIRLKGEMTGVEAAAAIRERQATPVVYLTAYADEQTLEKAKITGPFGYLTKPVRDQDLRAAIDMALYKHDMEQRLREKNRELEKNTDRLREAQKLAKVGQWELDFVNDRLEWSPGVFHIFEIDPEKFEATYSAFIEAVHPEDRDKVNKAYTNSLKTKTPYTVYHRLLMEDGRVKQLREACRHEWDENGAPVRSVGVVQDITDLKAIEDALRESEARFRGLAENSPLSIVIADIHGTIEYVNPAFTRITGYSFEEVVGKNPRILKSDLHDAVFYTDLWQTIGAGKTWNGEICNRRKNRELFWEQAAIFPVKNENGQVVNYVAVKQDISDRKNLERLKEDVERIMRHDLKTPLNAIIGIPHILEMDDNLTEEQREFIGMIGTAGQRMLEMIDMSLDMHKMENGTYPYEPEPVDLTPVVRQIEEETRTLASSKNATLRFEIESGGGPVMVLAEKLLLISMLSNLVVNALEASPPDEAVAIAANGLDQGIVIAIHNMGAVPEPVRKDFFRKYATCGKRKGTGLGTYSAKLIAEAMNGRIRMTTSEETGTVVSVVLPKA